MCGLTALADRPDYEEPPNALLLCLQEQTFFGMRSMVAKGHWATYAAAAILPTMKGEDVLRVASVDNWYGILAGAIVVVGFSRAIYAAKGWAYYQANGFFGAKIAAFVAAALLSIIPTIQIIRWRRALRADAAFLPAAPEIAGVRRLLWAEAALFALIPAFAAAMARGYGVLAH